jgi:hypothetical protein
VRGADEACGFQDRSHALRRVNESAKGAACKPEEEVLHDGSEPRVPAITRISEGEQAARTHGRCAEQRFRIRVTANDAVERNDVRIGQRAAGLREVTDDELSGARTVTRPKVAARNVKVSGGGVCKRGTGQAKGGEFSCDHPNPRADIEKVEVMKRLAAEFGQEHARAGVRTAAPVAAQIALRYARTEEARSRAIARATRHAVTQGVVRAAAPLSSLSCCSYLRLGTWGDAAPLEFVEGLLRVAKGCRTTEAAGKILGQIDGRRT